jgi:hypothetical protein
MDVSVIQAPTSDALWTFKECPVSGTKDFPDEESVKLIRKKERQND